MKKIFPIIVLILICLSGYVLHNSIENKKQVIKEMQLATDELQTSYNSIRDTLAVLTKRDDNVNALIKNVEEEKKKVISIYIERQKLVEKMNQDFMKTIDQNDDGIPDGIEIGDFNGNGIPDAVER